jgi:hypothetical protein
LVYGKFWSQEHKEEEIKIKIKWQKVSIGKINKNKLRKIRKKIISEKLKLDLLLRDYNILLHFIIIVAITCLIET